MLVLWVVGLTLVSALAPLYTQRETISDGSLRSHFVMFNDRAPYFARSKDKIASWLLEEVPTVDPNLIQHVYDMGVDFRGFAAWLSPEGVASLRAHHYILYLEEDQVMRINDGWQSSQAMLDPIKERKDWGQTRVNQNPKNLATSPAGLYNGTNYPSGSDASWNWATGVPQAFINTGSNAVIFVLDTGIVLNHQEFITNGASRVKHNYDATGSGNPADCNGHGTHCAGSAAGNWRGVAPGAELGSVRVLGCAGSGTNANVVAGINWISSNQVRGKTNIMSASLGGGASTTTDNAVNTAVNNGVVALVAAGNDGADACSYSPARAANAITVGATGQTDSPASFSNQGACVDVFAPGVSIHSSYYSGTSTTSYATLSGTSMATPLTSGSMALYATKAGGTVTYSGAISAIRTYSYSVVSGVKANTTKLFVNAKWA